jgi:hypothetical protein
MLILTPWHPHDNLPVDNEYMKANLSANVQQLIADQIHGYAMLDRHNVRWQVYSRSATSELLDSELELVQRMMAATDMFVAQMPLRTPVTITAFLLDYDKRWDRTVPLCSPSVMNTGWTTDDNHIVLYRTQEAVKVLLHELVHASGGDCRTDAWSFQPMFTVVGRYNAYESIAEVKAQLMYSVIVAHDTGLAYDAVLAAQVEHGLRMCALIVRMQDISQIREAIEAGAQWKQSTFVLEYFLYRTALMWQMVHGTLSFEFCLNSDCDALVPLIQTHLTAAFHGDAPFLARLQACMNTVDVSRPSYSITMNRFA